MSFTRQHRIFETSHNREVNTPKMVRRRIPASKQGALAAPAPLKVVNNNKSY